MNRLKAKIKEKKRTEKIDFVIVEFLKRQKENHICR